MTRRTAIEVLAFSVVACGAEHAHEATVPPRSTIDVPSSAPVSSAADRAGPSPSQGPPSICDDGHTVHPCVFQYQGKCFLEHASHANWEPTLCPVPPPPLTGDACRRTDQCRGVSDEGCCIECKSVMQSRIPIACAKRIEAATTCNAFDAAMRTKDCAGLR